jgi:hypothetical protein
LLIPVHPDWLAAMCGGVARGDRRLRVRPDRVSVQAQ